MRDPRDPAPGRRPTPSPGPAPGGQRQRGRGAATGEALLRVQQRVTGRDLTLLGWLADHGVLTTDQIAHALFPSLDFAQRRLLTLVRAGLVDRFRPQRPDGGSYPFHYVLAQLGLEVVAAQRDEEELPRREQARRRRWWLTNRANLPHLLAVNQFFTDLAGHARTHPGTTLERWWPSATCQRQGAFLDLDDDHGRLFFAAVAADGHGIWTSTHPDPPHPPPHRPPDPRPDGQGEGWDGGVVARVPFFVEVDLGTEDLPRLVGKIDAYRTWSLAAGRAWPVLFWLTSTVREAHLHQRLRQQRSVPVPVATAVHDPDRPGSVGPADPVWRLHQPDHWLEHPSLAGRRALADLAATVTAIDPTTGKRLRDRPRSW